MADTPPPPQHKPVSIPPSVGGSGLAVTGGLLLGRNLAETVFFGTTIPGLGWVIPVVLLSFVVVLIQFTLMARQRMGIIVEPSSIRRQWMVVGGALLLGLVMGAAFPYVNGR
jgi:hypothetical protein